MPGSNPCPLCVRFPGLRSGNAVLKVLKIIRASAGPEAVSSITLEFRSNRVKSAVAKELRKNGFTMEVGRKRRKVSFPTPRKE